MSLQAATLAAPAPLAPVPARSVEGFVQLGETRARIRSVTVVSAFSIAAPPATSLPARTTSQEGRHRFQATIESPSMVLEELSLDLTYRPRFRKTGHRCVKRTG